MRLTACALAVLAALPLGLARAQDYNPSAGASTAPANGTLTTPASPNGVDWLNSMLGLSPDFLTSTGQVNSVYVNVDLSAYAKVADLAAYAKLAALNSFTTEQHFAYADFADPDAGIARDAKFGAKGIAVIGGTKTDTLNVTGAATLQAQSTVQAGLVFWSRTYAALPTNPPTNVLWKCDDCTIGSGSAGVFVYYNGSAWLGLNGEAVTHP